MEQPKLTALEEKRRDKIANTPPTLDDAYDEDGNVDITNIHADVLDRVPCPTGWRIAILPYRVPLELYARKVAEQMRTI